jgi:hypothetical protein
MHSPHTHRIHSQGEEFDEEGEPHRKMVVQLPLRHMKWTCCILCTNNARISIISYMLTSYRYQWQQDNRSTNPMSLVHLIFSTRGGYNTGSIISPSALRAGAIINGSSSTNNTDTALQNAQVTRYLDWQHPYWYWMSIPIQKELNGGTFPDFGSYHFILPLFGRDRDFYQRDQVQLRGRMDALILQLSLKLQRSVSQTAALAFQRSYLVVSNNNVQYKGFAVCLRISRL